MLSFIDGPNTPTATTAPSSTRSTGSAGHEGDHLDRTDLAGVASGDATALERLYGRHRDAMYPFIRRYLGDRQLAEEAMQDTMVAVWEQAEAFRGDSLVRTWMFGIARFKALGIARRRAPDPIDPLTETPRLHAVDRAPGPESVAIERDRVDRVGAAIDALPVDQRECFLLAVSGRFAYDEIATMLEIEPGTVKSRVARARRALAPLRDEQGPTGGAPR